MYKHLMGMVGGGKGDWATLFSAVYGGRRRGNGQKVKYRTLRLSIRGQKILKPQPSFLGWRSNTGISCPEGFPEEVFPQLNLVNNSTGVYTSEQQPHPFWKNIVYCPQNYNDNQLLWLNPHRNKSADQLSKVHSEILTTEATGRSATNY